LLVIDARSPLTSREPLGRESPVKRQAGSMPCSVSSSCSREADTPDFE
jgi:hypothetical protein